MTWEILSAALFFAAGNVVYFEMSLPGPNSLLPSQTVPGERELEDFVTIPELPPITDAETAVKVAVPWQL